MIISKAQADAIDELSRTRTDGGLGVTFDGTTYRCADVRGDPAYSDFWPYLEVDSLEAARSRWAVNAAARAKSAALAVATDSTADTDARLKALSSLFGV